MREQNLMMDADAIVKRRLETFAERVEEIPPLPQIAMRVLEMVQAPDTSAADLERVISGEQSLAAKVLRMANSAFYGLPRAVSSLREGITFLGFRKVTSIVMSLAACDLFGGAVTDTQLFRARQWRHSLLCAVCARELAGATKRGDVENVFVAGLLHDIGKVVLDRYAHDHYAQVIHATEGNGAEIEICGAEREVLGFDHAQLGGVLSAHWGIPEVVTAPIRYHHAPALAPADDPALVDAVRLCHVGNGMTYGLRVDAAEDGLFYRPIDDLEALPWTDMAVVAELGVSLEDLIAIMEESGRLAREHESFFRRM